MNAYYCCRGAAVVVQLYPYRTNVTTRYARKTVGIQTLLMMVVGA